MKPPDIIIRPYVPDDIQPCYDAVIESREALGRWMPWCHAGYSMADTRGWVESQVKAFAEGTEYAFVIVDRENRVLGACGLNQFNHLHRHANLGYWVRTSCLGRGIATTAVKLLFGWALANTEFQRLEILAAVENTQSQKVAERAGAIREGVLRSRLHIDGRMHDAVVYSLIRPGPNLPNLTQPKGD